MPALQESRKKSRKLSVVILVLGVFAFSALIGWSIFWYQNIQCGLACGPPIDVPLIQTAHLSQSSSSETNCSIIARNLTTHCEISISRGDFGTISLNLKSENGDSRVQFGTNSTETSYIQFTSVPNCTYVSAPNYNSGGCIVPETGSTFLFNYTVSQSLPAPKQVIFTIVVTKTCCWP
jgi:hypothetical protein